MHLSTPTAAVHGPPTSMAAIAARVATLSPKVDVADVVARLEEIERERDGFYVPGGSPADRAARRPAPDGVACFNGMYLSVTRGVRDALADFESPAFVTRLDVVFAQFYFEACQAVAARAWCSRAWAPLFESAHDARVLPLQFAIAGMNAHINNDLSYALVQTWRELGVQPGTDTPEHRDYLRVNALLESVEGVVKKALLDPFMTDLDELLGRVDDWLALWNVAKARADAWDRAVHMHRHPDPVYGALHDRAVGFGSHLLLLPLLSDP